jgi:hypothetical protein
VGSRRSKYRSSIAIGFLKFEVIWRPYICTSRCHIETLGFEFSHASGLFIGFSLSPGYRSFELGTRIGFSITTCWMAKAISLVRTYERWGVYEVLSRCSLGNRIIRECSIPSSNKRKLGSGARTIYWEPPDNTSYVPGASIDAHVTAQT